ncbi:MAG: hypothetical protein ACK5JD_01275 [Mangrovibacterium sp.]
MFEPKSTAKLAMFTSRLAEFPEQIVVLLLCVQVKPCPLALFKPAKKKTAKKTKIAFGLFASKKKMVFFAPPKNRNRHIDPEKLIAFFSTPLLANA